MTYPEMDKLIALCKIFNCTMDDLTNDEISDIAIQEKQQKNLTNVIDELLNLINRSYCMFQQLSGKQIGKMIAELLVLIVVLGLAKIPFNWLAHSLSSIFAQSSWAHPIVNAIYFVFDIAHLLLSLIIFFYIYNMRYLSEFEKGSFAEEIIEEETPSENEAADSEKTSENGEDSTEEKETKRVRAYRLNEPRTRKVRDHSGLNKFISCLGTILMFGIKAFVILCAVPFIISLVLLVACLAVDILIAFRGVFFIGVMLGLLALIVLNYEVLEVVYVFIFNKIYDWRRLFFMFVGSLGVLGLAFGVGFIELSGFTIHSEISPQIEMTDYAKTVQMEEGLYIGNYYGWGYDRIEMVVDNSMEDTIEIALTYPQDGIEANVVKEGSELYINYEVKDTSFARITDAILADLRNKELYNYSYSYFEVTITGSEENLQLLQDNTEAHIQGIEQDSYDEMINEYENQLDEMQTVLDETINEYENQLDEQNTLIEEQQLLIQEYEDRISQMQEILQ